MNFKPSQEIRIQGIRGDKTYYHGGTVKQVPLGTKAVIQEIKSPDKINITLTKKSYGNQGR